MSLTFPGLFLEANTLTRVESGSIASKHFCYKEIRENCFTRVTIIFKSLSKQTVGNYFFSGKHQMKLRNDLVACVQQHLTQIIPTVVMPIIHQSCKRKHYSSCITDGKTEAKILMQLSCCPMDLKLAERTIIMPNSAFNSLLQTPSELT